MKPFVAHVIRQVAAILALSLPFGPVVAQTISVRSGEHADFTRLVLDIGAARTWQFQEAGSERLLTLTPPVDGFDIATVFDLIPRERLARLSVENGLLLSLACDCDVSATRYRDRYLVLDIAVREPSGVIDVAAMQPTARPRNAAPNLPDMTRLLAANGATAALSGGSFSRMDPGNPENVGSSGLPDIGSPPISSGAPINGMLDAAPSDVDLAEATRIMAEQLARAAASGLLRPAPSPPLSETDPLLRAERTGAEPTEEQAASSPARQTPEPRQGVPIRAETALDAALRRLPAIGLQRNQLSCQGDAMAIRNWSSGDGVDQGLGALRMALYDDRDALQRSAVVALAHHYLYYGFGAEAAYWLEQIQGPPEDLLVLAALVDETGSASFPPEPDPVLCSDEELLWRYLDGAMAPDAMTTDEVGRVQRAAAALPQGLRDQLAPRVARRLYADGHAAAARNLRDLVRRGGRLSATTFLELDLDLGLVGGDNPEVGAALAAAVRDDGGNPVSIMAHALAFDRGQGLAPSAVRLGAAEALLRETGIGPGTADLWLEVMLASASVGSIDRVVTLMATPDMPEPQREAAMTALLADRLMAGDTTALHVLAFLHGANWRAGGSAAGRVRVGAVAHLRDAGMNDAAMALEAGQPPLLLPSRPVMPPTEADMLNSAWQSNDWDALSALASGAHRDVALRMSALATGAPQTSPDIDLPEMAARLADSREMRFAISQLLAAPIPQLPEAAE